MDMATLLKEIEALIFGCKLASYLYEIHGFLLQEELSHLRHCVSSA